MDLATEIDTLLKTAPWAMVLFFAKRSLWQLEKRIETVEDKDEELLEALHTVRMKLEVYIASQPPRSGPRDGKRGG